MSGGYPWRTSDWPIYVAGGLPVLGALLLLAAELPARVLGGAWLPITSSDWLVHVAGILRHPLDPAAAWPGPQGSAAPGPLAYGATLVLLLAILSLPVVLVWRLRAQGDQVGGEPGRLRRRGRAGFAGEKELRASLDGRAAQRIHVLGGADDSAGITAAAEARRVDRPDEVGVHLGRDLVTGRELWGTWEDSYGIVGAPRQGKGLGFLVKVMATWPGTLVAPSTKPDNLIHTGLVDAARTRPLVVFDPMGLSGLSSVRWPLVDTCEDAGVAALRAEAIVFAAPEDPSVRGGRYWRDNAVSALRCYLHAAAIGGSDMRTVLRWARRHEVAEPLTVLRRPGNCATAGWADELEAIGRLPNETRASVFGQLNGSLGFLANPAVLEACCPDRAHPSLDIGRLLEERGRLFLLGTSAGQRSMAPLITALVETTLDTAKRRAARSESGRLSPALGNFLDEAGQIAMPPTLPSLVADGGGQGITTFVVLQSLGLARERWGEHGATALWDACSAKLVFGGLTSARDLEAIARVCPEVEEPVLSRTRSRDGWSESTSTRRVAAITAADIREIPRWQALLLYPGLRPVLTTQRAWWDEPRYARLIQPAKDAMEWRLHAARVM
jgi:type IV secretion system protein VirD4